MGDLSNIHQWASTIRAADTFQHWAGKVPVAFERKGGLKRALGAANEKQRTGFQSSSEPRAVSCAEPRNGLLCRGQRWCSRCAGGDCVKHTVAMPPTCRSFASVCRENDSLGSIFLTPPHWPNRSARNGTQRPRHSPELQALTFGVVVACASVKMDQQMAAPVLNVPLRNRSLPIKMQIRRGFYVIIPGWKQTRSQSRDQNRPTQKDDKKSFP